MIINIFKSVDNLLFCLHCVCTTCTSCLHYLHTACTLCTTCTTYLHCHSVMSVTGIRFFGRSDRFVYLPQLFVLRSTTNTARFRYKKCRTCRRCAIKVQAVQTACRFLWSLSTRRFPLNISTFHIFSADKSNYGHKMLDARARESAHNILLYHLRQCQMLDARARESALFLWSRCTLHNSINGNLRASRAQFEL